MKNIKFVLIVTLSLGLSLPSLAQDHPPEGNYQIVEMVPISTRAIVCREAINNRHVGMATAVVSSSLGYLSYRLWRGGGRTLLRKSLRRVGSVVTGTTTVLGATVSATHMASSMALMDLCTADLQELIRLSELSPAALATEEGITMQTLMMYYSPYDISSLIIEMIEGDLSAMENGIINMTPSQRSQEEILRDMEENPVQDFELPRDPSEREVEA